MKQRDLKVYVSGVSNRRLLKDYVNWINLPNTKVITLMEEYKHLADLFLFIGGPDINPNIYYEDLIKGGLYDKERDDKEVKEVLYAINKDIPMVGICRGAQLLCAMAGGYIIQDVTDHKTGHTLYIRGIKGDNWRTSVTSTHHQMMYPYILEDEQYELIAYSKGLSGYYLGPEFDLTETFPEHTFIKDPQSTIGYIFNGLKTDKYFKEPEIVWFKNINGLAIQGHPERMDKSSRVVEIINQYLNKVLNERIVL